MTANRRILAVDDEELFLRVTGDLLRLGGVDFHGLREPTRVVPEARAFKPDLILLDRVMPVLNGSEVMRSLHAFEETAAIPVALVTADRSERELLRALAAGAVDVIFKPFSERHVQRVKALIDELEAKPPPRGLTPEERAYRNLLAVYWRDKRTGVLLVNPGTPFEGRAVFQDGELRSAEFGPLTGPPALREMLGSVEDGVWRFDPDPDRPRRPMPPPPPPGRNTPVPQHAELFTPRVLVVDDDAELRRLFRTQLARSGFDVVLAEDGVDAVDLSTRSIFDVVIADLNMPRLDGWGMLKQFRADHRTRELPVIFLSAHDDYRETLRAARAGAADYLSKTGRAETVIQRVLALLMPRLDTLSAMEADRAFDFEVNLVGIQWLLRAVARLKKTGTLTATDEWARYSVTVRGGVPVSAQASWPNREAKGVAAIAALLVSRSAEGRFVFDSSDAEDIIDLPMETLLQRTCDTLNQLEARVMASRLNSAGRFVSDRELYELYRRIAPDAGLRLARAIVEEQLSPGELPLRLGIRPEEVQEGLKELLRRGVIRFAETA